jgi:hypothetical protein
MCNVDVTLNNLPRHKRSKRHQKAELENENDVLKKNIDELVEKIIQKKLEAIKIPKMKKATSS